MPTTLVAILIVVVIVAVVAAAGAAVLARMARAFLRSPTRRPAARPADVGLRGEPFAIPTEEGAVRGWVLESDRPRAAPMLVVATHGWASSASDMLSWIAPIVKDGHRAIVYDVLGHGDSDERDVASIRHFVDDLRIVLRWSETRMPEAPIVLFGHSLGGAASIVTAAESTRIRGVIVAAAPMDPVEVTREWLDAKGRPGALMVAMMRPFWRPIIKVPYEQLVPLRRIRDVRAPILILHGDEDRQVAVHHAHELAAAQPSARLEILSGLNHFSVPSDPRYEPIVTGFLDSLTRP